MRKKVSRLALLASIALGATTFLAAPAQAEVVEAVLTVNDCIKCHQNPPRDIDAHGGKHKTEVTCLDCHEGHPPAVTDNIPKCSKCHEGEPHFQLDGCLNCHTNPHTPLNITLADGLTAPCLTCHTEQIEQLKQFPSKHTELSCSFCHDKHGYKPECFKCHEPHKEGQTFADCVTCHRVHKPLMIEYPEDVASENCAACHEDQYTLLKASTAKHSALACAFCHQNKHKMIPKCQDCHGLPHPEGIHEKFPQCTSCHGSPHNLNK